jgi:hypothetical protein
MWDNLMLVDDGGYNEGKRKEIFLCFQVEYFVRCVVHVFFSSSPLHKVKERKKRRKEIECNEERNENGREKEKLT